MKKRRRAQNLLGIRSREADVAKSEIQLTLEQIAEIELALSDHEPFATDSEVRAVFQRLTTT